MTKFKLIKIVKMDIPIYPGTLEVYVSNDFNEALDKLHINIEGDYSNCYGLSIVASDNKTKKTRRVILLCDKPSHATISHECLHLTHRILNHVGIDADYDNDEAECYLHDWIVAQTYLGLNKQRIKVYLKEV